MSVRKITSDNDFTFGAGLSNYVSESDEIKQNVKTRVQMWKENCFFALLDGVDYNRYLTGLESTSKLLEADIRRVIVQTFGVAELQLLEIKNDDRELQISYKITDIYSQTWEQTINNLGVSDA